MDSYASVRAARNLPDGTGRESVITGLLRFVGTVFRARTHLAGLVPVVFRGLPSARGDITAGVRGRVPTLLLIAMLSILFLAGCATGPQTQFVVQETFSIEASGDASKQTKGSITAEDLGELADIIPPVRVQACKGPFPQFHTVKVIDAEGNTRTKRRPVFEEVDPFRDLYVRRLRIRNDSGHVLSLNRTEAVLADAAGNDHAGMTTAVLQHFLRASRPCPSTDYVIASLRGLKFLGNNIRLRPGRVAQVLVAFAGVDKRILGDWMLELHGFPVNTDQAGMVSRVASFEFPLISRGYRVTIELRKETTFGPWNEINRTMEDMGPGP